MLVACDGIAGLTPRDASQLIGQSFAQAGAQVAVVPLADGGDWLASSVAEFDPTATVVAPADLPALLDELGAPGEGRLVVDLTATARPSVAELAQLATAERLDALRSLLGERPLVAIVNGAEVGAPLTGLTGSLAERGRRTGAELVDTLADDTRASAWVTTLGLNGAVAGTGGGEGLGAVVLALGGAVTTGIDLCIDGFALRRVIGRADVVVTGAAQLDFHAVGGDVVKRVAQLAGEELRPVIAVVGRNFVSARELRLAGIESAYPVLPGAGDDEPTADQLAAAAAQVAATWRW